MRLLPTLLLLALGAAQAHTEVTGTTPAANARVRAPDRVVLNFSEPINLRFSTFKVLPLPAGADAAGAAAAALARKTGAAPRADTASPLSGLAARVTLPLRPDLRPGAYLIVWRLLSDDGHPVSGHSVFHVR